MRAVAITKALAAASATNIALSQTPLAAGFLTINGAAASGGVATLDTHRRVIITSAGNDASVTFTVIGTAEGGGAIKDSFAGGNIAAAQSNIDFLTVTSIYSSAATAAAVTAGTNGVGSSPWKMFGDTIATPNMDVEMQLVTGSGNASFEYTPDPFLQPIGVQPAIANAANTAQPLVLQHPVLTVLSASMEGQVTWPVHGWRLTINSGTGTWKCTARQAGLASP